MSQTNTNTNNGQNQKQNSRWGGQGQGGPGGGGRDDRRNKCGHKSIEKYAFEEQMKDSPISELTITETGHRTYQFKKIYDALLVFCADENYVSLSSL